MNRDDLLNLISRGENSGVEFKRDAVRPEKLAKEIVAMANLQGGYILIGVEDNGSISGIQRKNLAEWLVDTVIGRYVHPMILPFYEEIEVEAGRAVAVVSFPQGVSKPYVVRNKDREDIYIRVGGVSRLATREQQVRLFESGGILHTEVMPVPGSSIDSLDLVRLENYLRDILSDPEVPSNSEEWKIRLEGLGLMVKGRDQKYLCTIAGLVLFGINPRKYLKQAGLRVMVFEGLDKEYRSLMDRVLDGPMLGRWRFGDDGKELIDEGVIEKCIGCLEPFISTESATIDRSMRREKYWKYPLDAIRETILNALAHRDWTRFVDIEITVYRDRIEVVSPGALQDSMTVEKMKAGLRSTRNQILVEVLKDYGYVDARGMGIRTKVIPLMKAAGKEPGFEATEDYLKTILFDSRKGAITLGAGSVAEPSPIGPYTSIRLNRGAQESGNRSLKRSEIGKNDLINVLRLTPQFNYDQIAEVLGISPATVKRRMQMLKQEGLIKRIGSKKTGYWEVL